MSCRSCDLPDSFDDDMTAFLWPAHGHVVAKVAGYLSDAGLAFDNLVSDGCIRVQVPKVSRFLLGLSGLLTDAEQADTRILITRAPEPGLREFGDVRSVSGIISRLKGDWVIELLREERYHSVVQPICRAGDPSTVIGHEYLLRGVEPDGSPIPPAVLFGAAEDPRVFFSLDRAARISAVRTAARHDVPGNIFINFMPGSIYDPNVCLRTTASAVTEAGIDPGRVVFEIVESQRIADLNHLRGIVNFYRSAGFRVALDDFGAGHANLNTYVALEPDYVKLDKDLIRNALPGSARLEMVRTLVSNFHHAGIEVIAEGIETEAALAAVRSVGVDHVQGYLFGRPALPQQTAA